MLKSARKAAGLSIEQAAFKLHIGMRTLVNYETKNMAPPDVLIDMEQVYGSPNLHAVYCSDMCPIGQKYACKVEDKGIAVATLKLLKEINEAREVVRGELVDIVSDGDIGKHETEQFRHVMQHLLLLKKQIAAIEAQAADIVPEIIQEQKKTAC